MDFEFVKMCFQLIFSLGVVLLLIFIISKMANGKITQINNKKYMKIVDRLMITKDNSIVIIKVGEKGYIISNTSKNIEVIDEIPLEEIEKIEKKKAESVQEMQNIYGSILCKIRESKGKRHED